MLSAPAVAIDESNNVENVSKVYLNVEDMGEMQGTATKAASGILHRSVYVAGVPQKLLYIFPQKCIKYDILMFISVCAVTHFKYIGQTKWEKCMFC